MIKLSAHSRWSIVLVGALSTILVALVVSAAARTGAAPPADPSARSALYPFYPDQSQTRLPQESDQSNAVILGDVDGDTDLDLVVVNAGQDRLLLNDGTGVFTDTVGRLPAEYGQGDPAPSLDAELVDVDGDTDLDLLIAGSGQNRLLLNDGTGVYTDATATRLPADSAISFGVAAGDVDGVNGPDIVVANAGAQNRLLLNDGSGAFVDVTDAQFPGDSDRSYGVALGDLDGDGDLDLVIANLGQNRLYRNYGSGAFANVTDSNLPARDDDSYDLALGDVDGDGDLDLVVANSLEQNRLYLNDGTGVFSDATATHLPADADFNTAVRLVDLDQDGDLDLLVTGGAQDRYLLNDGSGHYTDVTASQMPINTARTFGLDLGDLDGDGDLEVVLADPDGINRLLMNPTLGDPLPRTVEVITPTFALSGNGATAQMVVQAGFTDGITREVTLAISGTRYTSGDPGVVTVSADGLLTAVYTGTAVVTASNSALWDTAAVAVTGTPDDLYPVATIITPAGGTAIAGPTAIIGTAADPEGHLASYQLAYRFKGAADWIPFAAGTSPVLTGTLGTLDPTVLANGMYEVQLLVFDLAGHGMMDQLSLVVEGKQKVGNFAISFIDLSVPVAGLPIQVVRTYDSRNKIQGDFGVGWELDVQEIKLQESGVMGESWEQIHAGFNYCLQAVGDQRVSVTMPDGTVYKFRPVTVPQCSPFLPIQAATVIFVPEFGTHASLVPLVNTNVLVFGFVGPVELVDDQTLNTWDPDAYQLTDLQKYVYQLDDELGLERLTDPNGNWLTIDDDGIVHSSGVSVGFIRDAQGRITQVTDPMNSTITYQYDAAGDLELVVDREGYETLYRYNTNHDLISIKDALGRLPARNEYDDQGRLVATVDAEGRRTEFTHDTDARQEVIRDRLGHVTVYEYDQAGNVTAETDALGNRTEYTYDSRGNTLTETDALSNTTTYTYDDQDNMLSVTDPLGNRTEYTYNSQGQMLTVTDPMGSVITNTFAAQGNLSSRTDALGNTTSYTYDAAGNLAAMTDPLGGVTTYTYDGAGNRIRQVDPLGHATGYTYDANGNPLTETVTRTIPPPGRGALGGVVTMTTRYVYDGSDRLVQTILPDGSTRGIVYNAVGVKTADIDPLGYRTSYEYDARGNQSRIVYPDGSQEHFTYDAEGNRLTFTDRAGWVTRYVYDAVDQLVQTVFPDGAIARTEYDALGRVAREIDPLGNATWHQYHDAGRAITVTDALSNSTVYLYDGNGNAIQMTDANGHLTAYEYDAANRLVRTAYHDSSWSATAYDPFGRTLSETDQAGRTSGYDYDPLGRLITVTDALNQTTTYAYDEVGNLIAQTDANGHTTGFEYDDLGRRTGRTLPLGMAETLVYDAAGNLVSLTDFNGDTTTLEYDAAGRLTGKNLPGGSSENYSYTATGQRLTAADSRGTTSYEYDARDRLTRRTDPDGLTVAYTYDAAGNRTALIVASGTVSYTYDALNRLETVADPVGGTVTYTYDAVGNRASVAYPNGIMTEYTYDALNRLTHLLNRQVGGGVISAYTYTLGLAGHRTRVVDQTGRAVDYAYDATYKLWQESIDGGTRVISYSYDAVGNRLSRIDNGTSVTYTYDANDRLLAESGISYSYDDNGSTLSRVSVTETITYTYDGQNRLVAVETAGHGRRDPAPTVVTYSYDTEGIRVSKTVNGADVTRYLTDNRQRYPPVLEERDGGGALIASYLYGDDLVRQQRGATRSYYQYDGQMSTRQLTDGSGAVTDSYTYDAFGRLLSSSGTTANPYLYRGEQLDPNLGFYYLRARYADPNTGRFLTADPARGRILDPPSLHRYLYAQADPVNKLDPSGRFTLVEISFSMSIESNLQKVFSQNLCKAFLDVNVIAQCILAPAMQMQDIALAGIALDGGSAFEYDLLSLAQEMIVQSFSKIHERLGQAYADIANDLLPKLEVEINLILVDIKIEASLVSGISAEVGWAKPELLGKVETYLELAKAVLTKPSDACQAAQQMKVVGDYLADNLWDWLGGGNEE